MVTTPARQGKQQPAFKGARTQTRPGSRPAAPSGPGSRPARAGGAKSGGAKALLGKWMSRIDGSSRPSNGSSYYLIVGATVALVCIGLMEVLSASAAESISQGEDPYQLFLRESGYAVGGLVLMFVLSRVSVKFLKWLAWPAVGFAIFLLGLVDFTPLGYAVGGNRNWIQIGSFSAQPSEAAKLALALWLATVLSRKGPLIREWKHAAIPVVPVAGAAIGLILLGHDLGTSVIVMIIVAAGMYFAGTPAKLFLPVGIVGGLVALVLALTSGNRTSRLAGWLGNCSPTDGLCDQAQNGLYALASGRWFGVGLGQSRQKWSWIPEAHNDFIFAIIGEEFGLIGTILIVVLYAILAIAIFRVIVRHNDPFIRIVCGCIMTWIIGQAFVNIAMVCGLLPVIGVPLPLISYGGTALVLVLAAIGIVLSFARKYPDIPKIKESEQIPS